MASVASEASAVHHAPLGHGLRGSLQTAEPADQASSFATLLDGSSDPSPAPKSPPMSLPPASQTPPARPQDGHAAQSSSAETSPGTPQSPPGSPSPESQTGAAPPQSKGLNGPDIAETALGALAKKVGNSTKAAIDTNVDATAPNTAPNTSPNNAADAAAGNAADPTTGSSTATTIPDNHGNKIADSSAFDAAAASTPPGDPSANPAIPVAPQPVAVPLSAPAIPTAPITIGSGAGSGTGQEISQIAASSDAVKADAPREKTDRAGAEASTAGTRTDGRTTPGGAKTADALTPTSSLAPQPTLKEPISPTGPGQPNAADRRQSRNGEGNPATVTATGQTGEQGLPPTEGTVGPQADSNRNPGGPANPIEDITRHAIETTVRRIEAPADETAGGGISGSRAGGAQPPPGGAGGLIAPAILTASADQAAAAITTATPAAIPIAGLAVEIAARAHAGNNRFDIRLDPPELGRIDVRLDVDRDGKVTSRIVVDRLETLDILRRDAPELERSLQQAGLTTADNALQFSLRDHGFGGQNPYPNNGTPADALRVIVPDPDLPPVEGGKVGYGRLLGANAGIDIRV